MWVAGSQIFMHSVTVSFRAFFPVRVDTGWFEPDEVCELGGIGFVGPVDPPPLDWPSVVVAVVVPFVAALP